MDDFLNKSFTQSDIDNFISSQAEESINLEFKRGDALKNEESVKKEIAKDVSAFANSDGGIIVYGIGEKNNKADELFFINGNEIKKEWLEQVINSRIQRKIEGLIIDCIRYEGKTEQTIFVVKIPRSLNAPHRTSDKKFYKRYNFESVEMEEYEIRDLYNRHENTQIAIVEPKFKVFKENSNTESYFFRVYMEFNIKNIGKTIEKLYKVELYIPRNTALHSNTPPNEDFFKHWARMVDDTHMLYSFPNRSPLFQEQTETIATVHLKLIEFCFDEIMKQPIKVKLYYTNGTEEKSYMLLDMFEYNGRKLTLDDFNINRK